MITRFLTWFLISVTFSATAQFRLIAPEWKMTLKVIDEAGKPVPGATATIGYHVAPPADEEIALAKKFGQTDTNGIFVASKRSRSFELLYSASKSNYYSSGGSYDLGPDYQYDPKKWSPTVTMVLKRIGNPIPMYGKRVDMDPPVSGSPVGYDLTLGDWVAPHGKGKHGDIMFAQYLRKKAEYDFDYKLVVSFPNAGDGIQPFSISEAEGTSTLRSGHDAPESGYRPEWVKVRSHHPGYPNSGGLNDNLNFYFRVRTTLDEQGRIKSAQYGKIYGDFMDFRYYLNPSPNSRNIECDPKVSLLKVRVPSERLILP